MRALLLWSTLLLSTGGSPATANDTSGLRATNVDPGPEWPTAAAKLRTYCQSCHGLGQLRFIFGTDDLQLWRFITSNRAPSSGKLWSEAITDVLSWPSGTPPAFDELKDPAQGRDWMPKGAKRLQLADDDVDGRPAREIILDALR